MGATEMRRRLSTTERIVRTSGHLRISGSVETRSAARVRAAVRAAITDAHGDHLVVDLSGVERLDAAGVASLLTPLMQYRREGGQVSIELPDGIGARTVVQQTAVLRLLAQR